MAQHYINIGIDLGIKTKSHAQIRDDQGKKLGPNYSLHVTKESLDDLCAQAKRYSSPESKIRLIVEATGMAWLPVAIYGKVHDYEVVRVKAQKVHNLRKVYSHHQKDDKVDAKTLAMMPIVDRDGLREVHLIGADVCALIRRCRQRERLVKMLTAQKNRICSLLDWAFPGVIACFPNPFGVVAKMFYRHYTNPFKVREMAPERLVESLRGMAGEQVELETGRAIVEVAKKTCALYEGSEKYIDLEEVVGEIIPEVEILKTYQNQLHEVEEEMAKLYEKVHPERFIESIPGIAEKLGPALYGVIGAPERFKDGKKCRAFMGYIPRRHSSGSVDKKGLKMSKAGPSSGRRDFYLAADVARRWDPQLAKVYYDEMVHKGNPHTKAVCAVAVRMIDRVLRILKDERDYKLRDVDGHGVSKKEARKIIKEQYTVPEEVRERLRNRKKKRERNSNYVRGYSKRNTPNKSRSRYERYSRAG